MRILRLVTPALVALSLLAVPAMASASHQMGGSLSASATAGGHLTGELVYMEKYPCTVDPVNVGTNEYLTLTAPDGVTTTYVSVDLYCTYSTTASGTYSGNYDIDIAAAFGGNYPGDGFYKVTFASCCRISGILNMTGQDTSYSAGANVTASQTTNGPAINSNVATGIAKGSRYLQSLNATGTKPLVYTSLVGSAEGPTYDVVTISPSGVVEIPAAVTATFSNGDHYVYRVRVTDPDGNYAERDVLLTVTDTHTPPTISGLDSQYTVQAGASQTVNFTGSDSDFGGSQTVTLSATNLPNWVTFTQTPGNPANGQLVIAPPPGTPNSSYVINVDAVDDDSTVPLTTTKTVKINVGVTPPVTTIVSGPSNPSGSASASFTFNSDQSGSTFECKLDSGSWGACTSPKSYTGLSDGTHIFAVRATKNGVTDDAPPAYSWIIDTSGVPVPQITQAPGFTTTSTTGTFHFTLYGSAVSAECKLDAGSWEPCTSPKEYTGLGVGSHTFYVRAQDATPTNSLAESYTWEVLAPGSTHTVAVTKSGDGGGNVSSDPGGIDCGFDCSEDFSDGASVTLTANPDTGSKFVKWTGDIGQCTATEKACTLTVDQARTLDAEFSKDTPTPPTPPASDKKLTVDKSAGGSVSSDPAGIDCGSSCEANFPSGSKVKLTAKPAAGYKFSSWEGACASQGATCEVEMTEAKSAKANFVALTAAKLQVQVDTARSSVKAGQTLPVTIDVENLGEQDATNATVCFTIPTGFSFVSATKPYTRKGSLICWKLGDIPGAEVQTSASKQVKINLRALKSIKSGSVTLRSVAAAENAEGGEVVAKAKAKVKVKKKKVRPRPVTG